MGLPVNTSEARAVLEAARAVMAEQLHRAMSGSRDCYPHLGLGGAMDKLSNMAIDDEAARALLVALG
jgi:hypothetical protein